MNFYDFEEIKKIGNCVEFMRREFAGIKESNTDSRGRVHFEHPPWRPESDSQGFLVWQNGWKDYAKDKSGTILDLCASGKFNGDLMQAQEFLGQYYNLEHKAMSAVKKRIIKEYIYNDANGNPVHKTIRYEPKDFRQAHVNILGEWESGLDDIEPVLYRLPELIETGWVCVVGGEKDADNLTSIDVPATTNAGGEGNWRKPYNEFFRGKDVVIIPDNDEKGQQHAQLVRNELQGIAGKIIILQLPGLPKKGDASDWIAKGGTKEQLLKLIKSCPDAEDPKEIAKLANQEPYANFEMISRNNKHFPDPLHINDLVANLHRRLRNFPRKVGLLMFDYDTRMKRIRYFTETRSLFAWIQEKTNHRVNWKRIEGAVTKEELFESLHANAREYEMIAGTPHYPLRQDVYYTYGELPPPSENCQAFQGLIDMFCPSSHEDKNLLRVLFASPLYFEPHIKKPFFVIDSSAGQGVGKTTLVELLAYLYGSPDDRASGEPIWIEAKQLNNETQSDRVVRRILSKDGRNKRIVLIDNVVGYFRSPKLAEMITQSSISGLAPFGKSEETRPNDLTYVVTSNSAMVDKDLTSRGYFIEVQPPTGNFRDWERNVINYINKNRLQIFSDIISILQRGVDFDVENPGRFATWTRAVMLPMLGSFEAYSEIFKRNYERQMSSDGEQEEANDIREMIIEKLRENYIAPETEQVWIQSHVLTAWAREAIPEFGGKTGRGAIHFLRTFAKNGMIPELSDKIRRFPTRGDGRKSGMMWNYNPGQILPVKIVGTASYTPTQKAF